MSEREIVVSLNDYLGMVEGSSFAAGGLGFEWISLLFRHVPLILFGFGGFSGS